MTTARDRGHGAGKGEPEEHAVAEIEEKIIEAFEVFNKEKYNAMDVRHIGTIIRSLGGFPTEAEVQEVIAKVGEESPTEHVNLKKFLPVMTKIILDKRYFPIPEDVLLCAFEVLDQNKCECIAKENLVKYLTEEGERFTPEETEKMLSAAVDPETNTVHYKDYVPMLVADEDLPL